MNVISSALGQNEPEDSSGALDEFRPETPGATAGHGVTEHAAQNAQAAHPTPVRHRHMSCICTCNMSHIPQPHDTIPHYKAGI